MTRGTPRSRNGPMDRLKSGTRGLVCALGNRAVASVRDRLEGTTSRLAGYVEGGGGPGLIAAATGARNLAEGKSKKRSLFGAGLAGAREKLAGLFRRGKGGSRKLKLTNIVESVDVGVPVRLAYNQWTQYSDFPEFTKKVENVDQNKEEENKTNWKAQVFWSHRTWEATVVEQVPDDKIVWRSKGQKGHVDGTVTFHELAPNLTRILVVLEYHPQGMFERTGNLWRAQGRRARLEVKHFRRHMMTEGVLHPDDIEGWRGTIHDGEVVESHEDALEREEEEKEQSQQSDSRRSGHGRTAGRAERHDENGTEAAGEGAEDESRGEDTGNSRAASDEDTGNSRPASGRSGTGTSNRGRRNSLAESSDAESRGNGRRQRAGAAAQRGGST
jgi:uncharacterized membrane protein